MQSNLQAPLLAPAALAVSSSDLRGRYLCDPYYRAKSAVFNRYDPGSWRETLKIHMTPFLLYPWLGLTAWTLLLAVALRDAFPGLVNVVSLQPTVHMILASALGFLMVFRTNAAYSKWWEARTTWGVVNNSTRSLIARAPSVMRADAYRRLLTQLVAFAVCLKNHLRGVRTLRVELGELLPYDELIAPLDERANPPLAVVHALAATVRDGLKTKTSADALIAGPAFLQFSTLLDSLAAAVGACERIKSTRTPFGYVSALRCFLLLWLYTMPFALVGAYGLVAVVAASLVGFLFLGLEQMALEIEQPFGDDPDDLPLEDFCLAIEQSCLDFLERAPPDE